LATLLSQVIKL